MILGISGKAGSGKDTVGKIIQWLTADDYDDRTWLKENPEAALNLNEDSNKNWVGNPDGLGKFKNKKFGGMVKQITSLITGCTMDDLENRITKESEIGPEWGNITYRDFMTTIATNCCRDMIHENTWVNALFRGFRHEDKWIITDVRFLNEIESVKARGGILIRVNRDIDNSIQHRSETELDDYEGWDYVIDNNVPVRKLIDIVETILIKEKLL